MKILSLLSGLLLFINGLYSQSNSEFISQTAPSSVSVGDVFTITATFKNTGATTWKASELYRMGTQNPQDNSSWGAGNRIELPHEVAPGQEVTFTVDLITPENGNAIQWQMVHDGVEWFGEKSDIHYIAITTDPALDSLLTPESSFSIDSHVVGTSMFHWYGPGSWQFASPWIPIEGRENWAGDIAFWKKMIKQTMAANIDVYYILVIPTMEQQRINLFRALFELRREGWDVPKVCPFFDPMITYSILGVNGNASTTAGKDELVGHYIRFYNQYYSQNTDEFADDFIYTQDEIPVLDTWHVHLTIDYYDQLTRYDVESRLSAAFGDDHPIFNNGIKMITNAISPTYSFADEKVYQFEEQRYKIDKLWNGITTSLLKPGYWDQNIRNPGYFLPRDGGSHYIDSWNSVNSNSSINRVCIESFNEYDEGSGINATKTDTIFITTASDMNNTNSDVWSSANDPYEYIKTTAYGAAIFNDDKELDAKILWHNIPETMARAETFVATIVVRNAGNESWNATNKIKFGELESQDPVLFGPSRYLLDDSQDDIPEYGGIFRGRAKIFSIEITAPENTGDYITHWGMLKEDVAWFGDVLEVQISVSESYNNTDFESVCAGDSILWHDEYYSVAGSYYDSSITAGGLDSIHILDLSIISIDPLVTQNNASLTANHSGAEYQWMNCETSELLQDETSQNFTAIVNGNYAVIITDGNCIDTSLCYSVISVGVINFNENKDMFKTYPNPVSINGSLNIEGDFRKNDRLFIISINGAIVYGEKILSDKKNLYLSPAKSNMKEGVYIIQIVGDNSIQTKKILIKN